MIVTFISDVDVEITENICCFTGRATLVKKTFKSGDSIDCCEVFRGEKAKGGRVLTCFINNKNAETLHPDRFTILEKLVEIED